MKIKLKSNNSNLSWKDLDYGDVFIFTDDSEDDSKEYVGMKIAYLSDYEPKEYLLDLEGNELYEPNDLYGIVRKIDCELIER